MALNPHSNVLCLLRGTFWKHAPERVGRAPAGERDTLKVDLGWACTWTYGLGTARDTGGDTAWCIVRRIDVYRCECHAARAARGIDNVLLIAAEFDREAVLVGG